MDLLHDNPMLVGVKQMLGAFAKAEIVTDAGQPAVVVAATSIVTFAGIDKVLTVARDRAVEKRVVLGRRLGDRVEVLSGLEAGEPVVLQPGNLVGGQAVALWVATKDPAAVRTTKDVDILIRKGDLPQARAAAQSIDMDYFEVMAVGMSNIEIIANAAIF